MKRCECGSKFNPVIRVEKRFTYGEVEKIFYLLQCDECRRKTKDHLSMEGALKEWNEMKK